ncbi:hypothetical protein GQ42DRAFT_173672 [Ramicandelaber brevisporus]|nr:hypothetical protein GQ42DRAFT_173672 [Ramicandelaber brevisporus]
MLPPNQALDEHNRNPQQQQHIDSRAPSFSLPSAQNIHPSSTLQSPVPNVSLLLQQPTAHLINPSLSSSPATTPLYQISPSFWTSGGSALGVGTRNISSISGSITGVGFGNGGGVGILGVNSAAAGSTGGSIRGRGRPRKAAVFNPMLSEMDLKIARVLLSIAWPSVSNSLSFPDVISPKVLQELAGIIDSDIVTKRSKQLQSSNTSMDTFMCEFWMAAATAFVTSTLDKAKYALKNDIRPSEKRQKKVVDSTISTIRDDLGIGQPPVSKVDQSVLAKLEDIHYRIIVIYLQHCIRGSRETIDWKAAEQANSNVDLIAAALFDFVRVPSMCEQIYPEGDASSVPGRPAMVGLFIQAASPEYRLSISAADKCAKALRMYFADLNTEHLNSYFTAATRPLGDYLPRDAPVDCGSDPISIAAALSSVLSENELVRGPMCLPISKIHRDTLPLFTGERCLNTLRSRVIATNSAIASISNIIDECLHSVVLDGLDVNTKFKEDEVIKKVANLARGKCMEASQLQLQLHQPSQVVLLDDDTEADSMPAFTPILTTPASNNPIEQLSSIHHPSSVIPSGADQDLSFIDAMASADCQASLEQPAQSPTFSLQRPLTETTAATQSPAVLATPLTASSSVTLSSVDTAIPTPISASPSALVVSVPATPSTAGSTPHPVPPPPQQGSNGTEKDSGAGRKNKCGLCQDIGHNSRRCPRSSINQPAVDSNVQDTGSHNNTSIVTRGRGRQAQNNNSADADPAQSTQDAVSAVPPFSRKRKSTIN